MTRMEVAFRVKSPKKLAHRLESPPSYDAAQDMAPVAPVPAFGGHRKQSSCQLLTGDEDTESYAESVESDPDEDIKDEENAEDEIGVGGEFDNGMPIENEKEAGAAAWGDFEHQRDSDGEKPKARTKAVKRERERQSLIYYDQHTYTVISRLRAVNKHLSQQLEQQKKRVMTMAEEKKQHLQLIESLRTEVHMHKQTLRALHPTSKAHEVVLPAVPRPPKNEDREDRKTALRRPLSPPSQNPRKSPRLKTPLTLSADQTCTCGGKSASQDVQMYATKLEKAEEERRDLQQRHAHQLASYSHELSRLERLLEKAHIIVQEKENELVLQRTRQLYCSTPTTPTSSPALRRRNSNSGSAVPTAGRRETLQVKNVFSDDIWKGLLPLPPASETIEKPREVAGSSATTSFTSHVGQAFEQLLSHQLVTLHDNTLDRSTRDWLLEVKQCGSQMLTLHHSFQVMARSLQRVAESTHLYQLAETLTDECRELMQTEQVLVLVVDKSGQEFWCRMPSRLPENELADLKPQLSTVRSVLPHMNHGGPCGLAAFVYHTKRPLLLSAGQMTRHSSYSGATDNADRLVQHPYASTLVVPVLHENRVLAVVQVSGKLTQVKALGLSIALERCESFSAEDQALMTLLCHFSSGLFPKVAYFTDVESNKVNEETFIQLAPGIFTCLHFDELGKVVIENAKSILDADRCSLFVADSATRTLHNWHSDISGAGVEVYRKTAQKANVGMTIHFGQGIVGLVAETQQSINIPDAYDDPRFNSAWDQKTHYRTKSMLTVPIISNVGATDKTNTEDEASAKTLLGVVQVINKSGGAPFRAKDEFLLQTISKLIALAIENSQLFQRNQELCWNVGKLIADGDLVEAIVSLGTAAEQIIGVEGAAVYVVDPDTHELVTFHHKRRYRIALSESAYAGSLMEEAVRSQKLTIANDIAKAGSFNAFVDSLGGIPARNVLFAPLVIEDMEGIIPDMKTLESEGLSLSSDSGMKLVGLLQLVNIKGRKTHFDEHDLFLSIVQSQSCSVLAAILEKQRMIRQKEQITLLLDASMSFFKEMSVVGVINAVYNACVSIFDADTIAHLFVWEENAQPASKDRERHLWSSKICPQAAAELSTRAISHSSSKNLHLDTDSRGTSMSFIPTLGTQSRKLSVVTDQTLRAPTSEGLFQQVLLRSSAVIVKNWIVDEMEEEDGEGDLQHSGQRSKPTSAARGRERQRVDSYTVKAARSDVRLGFIRHAVVACPVWSNYSQEIVGVLVLLFPRDHPAVAAGSRSEQLSTLPILTRQISGALGVCHDLVTVSTRARKMQGMLELSRQAPKAAVSLTLTSRGHLGSFSQPVNLCSRSFSVRSLTAELHPIAVSNLTVHSLFMDEEGHRWGFRISGASAHEMSCDHYVQWIGKHVELPIGCTEAGVFGKLRMDLQNVYSKKENITGVINTHQLIDEGLNSSGEMESSIEKLSRSTLFKIRQLLWDFTDATWQVDVVRASHVLFGGYTRTRSDGKGKIVSRRELELALGSEPGSAGISLSFAEWDQLYGCFADQNSDLFDVEAMLTALRPQIKVFPVVKYELAPVLDSVTQVVVSVQMLLFS
ncbi:Dual 3' [Phytophthora citrophthora]|uniref:Dual 3 n=1 Tax=Phytophthora citrophthora TaxID=4793 RepID=A0AAD9LAG3_9STRA|nr:Dual 3' [Phytophthora citrophthora]